MKNVLVWLLGITMTLNLPMTSGNEYPEETHDINLYWFGKGGYSPRTQSDPSGNLTTIAPNTITDEIQTFYPKLNQEPYDTRYWYSDPLKVNVSINGDVHFSLWVICSDPRYLGLDVALLRLDPGGNGYGQFVWTGSKLVNNEPVEFNAVIPEEDINDELKKFSIGDRIGIGIDAEFARPQPSAEVSVLYNSTIHPSHMTIKSNPFSINILNSKTSNEKASVDVVITDAFGVNDIVNYDVQVIDPSGKNINYLEITENRNITEGYIILDVTWDKSKHGNGDHTLTITVIDNNGNQWVKVKILELNFLDNGNGYSLSLNLFILLGFGILGSIIIYSFISGIQKKQQK